MIVKFNLDPYALQLLFGFAFKLCKFVHFKAFQSLQVIVFFIAFQGL